MCLWSWRCSALITTSIQPSGWRIASRLAGHNDCGLVFGDDGCGAVHALLPVLHLVVINDDRRIQKAGLLRHQTKRARLAVNRPQRCPVTFVSATRATCSGGVVALTDQTVISISMPINGAAEQLGVVFASNLASNVAGIGVHGLVLGQAQSGFPSLDRYSAYRL